MSGLEPPAARTPPPSRPPLRNLIIWIALVAATFAIWMWQPRGEDQSVRPEVDYSTAYQWVNAGRVSEAVLDGQMLEGELTEPVEHDGNNIDRFQAVVPEEDESLLGLLRDKDVDLRIAKGKGSSLGMQLVIGLLPWVILIGFWLWMFKRSSRLMGGGAGPLSALSRKPRRYEKSTSVSVSFTDVAGLAAAKRDLREVVDFLREPQRFARLGSKIPRGVLLVGPPGTGKTLLARAVAGEADVPFFSISGSEFIEMFVGVGAARVRDLFEEARKSQPSIVFIDELDAVGRVRGTGLGGGNDEREQTLNQLLSEMDGFDRSSLVVVMAATNRPDVLDPALLRPGRFDRRVLVDLPEAKAREAILEVHLAGKPTADDVEVSELAAMTTGFSGADLANLVNESALSATRRDAERIHWTDCVTAYDKIVLGDPREGPLLPLEKKRVAVHESGHALVAALSPDAEPPRRISILPRGKALGVTHQIRGEDRNLQTRSELYARLQVLLAGYAAERLLLGDISTGAENDLREATRLASKMVAHYGMSDELGPVYYEYQEEHAFLGQRIATEGGTSDATIHAIEREARALIGRALIDANRTLERERARLERLVATLLEAETLEREQLEALLAKESVARTRAAS